MAWLLLTGTVSASSRRVPLFWKASKEEGHFEEGILERDSYPDHPRGPLKGGEDDRRSTQISFPKGFQIEVSREVVPKEALVAEVGENPFPIHLCSESASER
jgi:hypothetical protein